MTDIAEGTAASAGGAWRYCAESIQRTFADHRALYACAILFCGLTFAASLYWGIPLPFSASFVFIETLAQFGLLALGLAAAVQCTRMIRRGEDGSAILAMGRWLRAKALAGDRPGNAFHSLVTFSPLMIAFTALKDEIPVIQPFDWDRTFAHWDRVLGGGILPWQVLQPILGHPPITAAINFVYDFWFVIMFGALMWQAFAAHGSRLRTQFLLSFAFAWFIAGNVLATVFSSAGPCFYGHFFAHDPYAAQMVYLRQVAHSWPVWSVHVQDLLWQSYVSGSGAVSGISAMPSMHVTVAVLIALLCQGAGRRLGKAGWAFAVVIVIGSIHLAWHYAVDSIAAIVLAVVFWQAAGWLARLQERRVPAASSPRAAEA